VWRHVLPRIGEPGRLIAPDLIGMGDSGKPPIDYTYDDQARYLDAWFDAIELDGVILVGHDWGGALALDWASRNPGRVRGIALMETIIKPMVGDEFPDPARGYFAAIKTPGVGEEMILDQNAQLERSLGRSGDRVTDEDREIYRRPYPTRESRLPLLRWPRSMPVDGDPAEVVARVEAYDLWLAASPSVPKLLLAFDPDGPGILMGRRLVDWCASNISGLEIAQCGFATHVVPEDQPEAIAAAIVAWTDRHRLRAIR
jgi:haloalkane dehalogenase